MRNLLRRFSSPSTTSVINAVVIAASMLLVFSQLEPRWLLTNTTTAGGDMGAHVWAPWFLKHHLLPHGRVSGWTPDWYSGFPAFTFYFPLPAVMTALFSYLIPYNVAFKLVTVSGVISFPLATYLFGKFARLPFPAPACLAAATVPFLFDTGYTIFGGNIASTLAGEFSFSIGLSFAMVLLGLIAGGLDTGKRRGWAAVLFGAVILCHILPTLFVLVGGSILVLMRLVVGMPNDVPLASSDMTLRVPHSPRRVRLAYLIGILTLAIALAIGWAVIGNGVDPTIWDRILEVVLFAISLAAVVVLWGAIRRTPATVGRSGRLSALRWALPVGVIGGCLSGFWSVPFVLRSNYMNDMGWEKIGTGTASGITLYNHQITYYADALFPGGLWVLLALAFVSAVVAMLLRRRMGVFLVLTAAVFAAGFVWAPQGRLWNARLLPFWYLCLYLLAGLLVAEIGWGLADWVRSLRARATAETANWLRWLSPVIALVVAFAFVVPKLPPPSWWPANTIAPWHNPNTTGVSFIPSWATWNYTGYQGKVNGTYSKSAYPEYQELVNAMYNVGKTNGCGRAMWEYEPTLDRFGTPMALMLMPMFTNGCIGSMEGLFFESSSTVPYHFLNQALLSETPSEAMRDLPYGTLDVADGITHLQQLGVKYYMAVSPQAQQQAALDPRLTLLSSLPAAAGTDGSARTWNIYQVADSALVAPLPYLPVVMTSPDTVEPVVDKTSKKGKMSGRESWLENSTTWYQDPVSADVPIASSGPSNWPRVANADSELPKVPNESVNVSFIAAGDDRISFTVDKVGVPVVVRASYFPNWQAKGAKGPYRISPNEMVVIPTQKNVTLHYGHTPVDWYGMVLSLIGVVGVAWLWRRDRFATEPVLVSESEVAAGSSGTEPSESAAMPGASESETESSGSEVVESEPAAEPASSEEPPASEPPTSEPPAAG